MGMKVETIATCDDAMALLAAELGVRAAAPDADRALAPRAGSELAEDVFRVPFDARGELAVLLPSHAVAAKANASPPKKPKNATQGAAPEASSSAAAARTSAEIAPSRSRHCMS